jgi:hypothetical protein
MNREASIPVEMNADHAARERWPVNAAASLPPVPGRAITRRFNASPGVGAAKRAQISAAPTCRRIKFALMPGFIFARWKRGRAPDPQG